MNRSFFSFLLMTALFASVFTSCKKDTPEWFTDAQTKFENGRFVPDVEDILPGAILGTNTSTAAGTSTVKATTDYETIKFSDLKDNYWDGLGGTVNSIAQMRENMELYKQMVMDAFVRSAPTEKGVWKSDVKYDENGRGDKFIYAVFTYNGKKIYTKLSMYSDGANEIYYLNGANGDLTQYSYLKGDKFIYISCHNEYVYMISSDTENGTKKGKGLSCYSGNGEKGYGMMDFKGDNQNAFFYSVDEGGLINDATTIMKSHSAHAVIDGIPYGSPWQDIRAFANIEEIYFTYDEDYGTYPVGQYPSGYPVGKVCGLKLNDGALIEDNDELWRFRLYESAEYGKDAEGGWDILKTGGICGEYIMFWAGDDMSSPSAAIPAELSGLRYIGGFDELYLGLQSETDGYFDDFRLTEFVPVVNIEINYANTQAIINALLAYVQTHAEGFDD